MGEETITLEALADLPEYSCSIPTGTSIGVRWRAATQYMGERTEWRIGTYVPCRSPGMVGIEWVWAVSEPGVPWETDRNLSTALAGKGAK